MNTLSSDTRQQALGLLRNNLLGSFISRFSVGDTWDFYIDGYWLVSQDVVSEKDDFLRAILKNNFSYFESTVDKECISKSVVVAAAMRRNMIDVSLDKACNLKIEFDGGLKLLFPTNVDIVDWQWCLNKTGADPYGDFLVACFGEGEIVVNEKQD